MGVSDDKKEIFGDIAALNTLLGKMPKLSHYRRIYKKNEEPDEDLDDNIAKMEAVGDLPVPCAILSMPLTIIQSPEHNVQLSG